MRENNSSVSSQTMSKQKDVITLESRAALQRPGQTGEMGQQGPHDIQHGRMQRRPAPHLEQLPAKAGTCCLDSSSTEKDLRVPVSNGLNTNQQCAPTEVKANSRLSWIGKRVTSRSREVIFPLFSAVARLHLEYAVQFGIASARKVWIYDSKCSRGSLRWLEDWSGMCEEKLRELDLFSLRRLEGHKAAVRSCRKENPIWT